MKNILVLCTGNSARSILAEALLNHLGGGRVRAHSAGSHPKGGVHPAGLALLRAQGLATDGLRSKSWDEFSADGAPAVDIVITVCDSAANESCPIWPGAPVKAHWGIPDPAAVEGEGQAEAFRLAFARLKGRVEALLALDFDEMDAAALCTALSEIGAGGEGATAQARARRGERGAAADTGGGIRPCRAGMGDGRPAHGRPGRDKG